MPKATSDKETELNGSMGIRLSNEQRRQINALAKRQCNTVGGIIRLAIQEFIENERKSMSLAKRTGGKFPA